MLTCRLLQIKHAASGKCLQLNSTLLHIWDCEEGDATQLFGFQPFEDGHRIFVKGTLLCLSVESSDLHWVNVFKEQRCDDFQHQKYKFVKLDVTLPVLTTPVLPPVYASSGQGAVVNFTVTATDDVTRSLIVDCTPASGSTFPLGSTNVTCTATDEASNKGTATFVVEVVLGEWLACLVCAFQCNQHVWFVPCNAINLDSCC